MLKPIKSNRSSLSKKQKKPVIFCEKAKGMCFNTKGYFSSSQPYDQEYLKVKHQVYKKYRNGPLELVAIDPKQTKTSVYIQKGMLKPNNEQPSTEKDNKEKILNNFIKNYIHRKQKRQQIDCQKFEGSTKVVEMMRGDSANGSVYTIQSELNVKTERNPVRPSFSRTSTCKSNRSNKQN